MKQRSFLLGLLAAFLFPLGLNAGTFNGKGSGTQFSTCDPDAAIVGGSCTNHEEGTLYGGGGKKTYVTDSTTVFASDGSACGSVTGHSTSTYPTGDQVSSNFENDVCFSGAVGDFAGTYVITGGTGKYADISGGGTFAGTAICSCLTDHCTQTTCANSFSDHGTYER
jgi:hypothetical protein